MWIMSEVEECDEELTEFKKPEEPAILSWQMVELFSLFACNILYGTT